jgi:hypothetical protein
MKTVQPTVRIIPAKGAALFTTLVFAAILFVFTKFLLHDIDTIIINGKDVHRESPHRLLMLGLLLAVPVFGVITQALRLLPGSPVDHLEIGPQGFTVGKLFGRRRRRWDEISGFSTGSIALTKPPITWVRAEGTRPLRFFVTGYVRLRLFSNTDAQIREIAGWLDRVRDAYVSGDGSLPPSPDALAGRIIPQSSGKPPMQSREKTKIQQSRSSVIERRSRG